MAAITIRVLQLQGAEIKSNKWPGGVVPYQIDGDFGEYINCAIWVYYFTLIMKLCAFVLLLQLIMRREAFKLLSMISPIELASRSRNEHAKKITSPSRSSVGMCIYKLSLSNVPPKQI